jgi:hypothetical protein
MLTPSKLASRAPARQAKASICNDIVSEVGESQTNVWPQRLAAGLEAGVLAGLLMSAWLMFEGVRHNQSVWSNFNLISTVLVGRDGLRSGFGLTTVAGFSLQVVIAGLHGMLFAVLLSPAVRPVWSVNAGILFSIASYWVSFGWMIGRWAPLMALRASRPAWLGAHFLFGIMLGLYPEFARTLMPKPVTPEPVLATETPSTPSEETELR